MQLAARPAAGGAAARRGVARGPQIARCCAASAAGPQRAPRQHQQQQQQQQALAVHQQQSQQQQQQQRPQQQRRRGAVVAAAAAPALSSVDVEELFGPSALEPAVFEIVTFALKLAWTSETYYVHSWMVLLGLLKQESSSACQVLRELGLDDIYGAWHEVLWALNAADGLTPRAFTPRVDWGERAALILQGAVRFGGWAGRERVTPADLLLAFAASDVLGALFPDVDLSFDRVKRAIEKADGVVYDLPGYEGAALASTDMFV